MLFHRCRHMLSALLVIVVASGLAASETAGKTAAQDGANVDQAAFRRLLSAAEAAPLVWDNRDNDEFVVLDVRTPEEFEAGHIPEAVNVNARCPMFRAKIARLDNSKQYLLYCRGGVRSSVAADVMQEMEFKYLYDMKSGTLGWVAADFPFEGDNVPPPSSKEEHKLDAGGHRITAADGVACIPFEIVDRHLTLPVSIDGIRLNLALEPGMPSAGAILWGGPRVDELNLTYVGRAMVSDSGAEPVMAELAQGLTLSIFDLELNQQSVIVMPPDPEGENAGIDGMIGLSVLDRFVVEVDYDSSVVRLTEPESFSYAGSGQVIPLTMTAIGVPVLDVEITQAGDSPYPARLNLALAGSEPLLLNAGRFEKMSIPESTTERDGRRIGRVPALRLGDRTFDNVATAFEPDENAGGTAMEIEGQISFQTLPSSRIIVDYTGRQFILETP